MEERKVSFQEKRTESTQLLHQNPIKDLGVRDADAPKVLFLSVNPEHEKHGMDDVMAGVMPECTICRLADKFKEAIKRKSLLVLKRELKVKTLKLCQRDVSSSLEVSTLESNFSDQDDELDKEDEELLTFTEVLELLKIPLPQVLQTKLQIVLTQKKIPARQNKVAATEEEKRNTFLAYTNNKKLSEIGDKLTAEEVYALKEFTLKQKENDEAVIKMAEALSVIDDLESLKTIPGFKDLVFYYILLNLFKESLLNRLYTHVFEYLLKGARDSLPEPEKRVHIQDAMNQLTRYPLTTRPPGICIIFAMTIGRDAGATTDVQEVRKVFEHEFNYDVFVKLNPNVKDIKTLVTKLSAHRNMFYDSLVVWFMAHGDKTYLKVKDGEIHRRSELLQPFVDIDWLKNKPKLFFIQACANKRQSRLSLTGGPGLKIEKDALSLGMNASEDWKKKYAQHTDGGVANSLANTLVSYATMWYQPASRGEEGSLFINTLLDCMKQKGRETSIENVLRLMHYRVNTVCLNDDNTIWKQSPYYESSLQKEFIFP